MSAPISLKPVVDAIQTLTEQINSAQAVGDAAAAKKEDVLNLLAGVQSLLTTYCGGGNGEGGYYALGG